MTFIGPNPIGSTPASAGAASETEIPALVAQVYEAAPAEERCHLVETLLRPLGVLSLVAIAHGVFAKIRFRSAGHELKVRVDDLRNVSAADMMALVHHAQQVSIETVDSLVQQLSSSGSMTSSAAAIVLVGLLVQRARARRTTPMQARDASLDP